MTDREKIIDKIKKCLALSASSNEHEAAAALRQARKLMEAHNISDAEMLASGATEHHQRAGAKRTPSRWETHLATCIGDAFGCRTIFGTAYYHMHSSWVFIGCGAAPEIAGYAFEVLHRQCKRARETYIKASSGRSGVDDACLQLQGPVRRQGAQRRKAPDHPRTWQAPPAARRRAAGAVYGHANAVLPLAVGRGLHLCGADQHEHMEQDCADAAVVRRRAAVGVPGRRRDPSDRIALLSKAAKNIATLSRASVNLKQYQATVRAEVAKQAAAIAVTEAKGAGLSDEVAETIRRKILGVGAG